PPVDVYRDHGVHINPLVQTPQKLGNNGALSLDHPSGKAKVNLKETQIAYYQVSAIQDGPNGNQFVHQLNIDLSGVTKQSGAGVQAIITTGAGNSTQNHVEDWSDATSKSFCRDNPDQAISKLVLIVTDGNIKSSQKIKGTIDIEASGDSCQ